ncbi:MAG: hypothetical protein MZV64_12865 [Ignavibacteriales bacterium]|nr:hypothetical protein [Ignavibacteriales bacterium]
MTFEDLGATLAQKGVRRSGHDRPSRLRGRAFHDEENPVQPSSRRLRPRARRLQAEEARRLRPRPGQEWYRHISAFTSGRSRASPPSGCSSSTTRRRRARPPRASSSSRRPWPGRPSGGAPASSSSRPGTR